MRKAIIFLIIVIGGFGWNSIVLAGTHPLKTNTATIIQCGPFVSHSDGLTVQNSLTVTGITCELIKETTNGSAPTRVSISPTASGGDNDMVLVTSSALGMYGLELTAAQLNFLGFARVIFYDKDAIVIGWEDLEVMTANAWDSKYGTDTIEVDVVAWNGTAVATPATAGYPAVTIKDGTGTGEINTDSGKIVEVSTLTGHTAQTGDGYAILNNGTYGNSAIKTALDTASGYASDAKTAAEKIDTNTELRTLLYGSDTAGATAAGQTTITNHLTDIKGTGFVKDTHSLPQCLTATGFSTHAAADVVSSLGFNATAITNFNTRYNTYWSTWWDSTLHMANVDIEYVGGTVYSDALVTQSSLTKYLRENIFEADIDDDPNVGSAWYILDAIGATGTGLSAIPWNSNWDAEVESEVDDALGAGTGTSLTAIPWNSDWDAEVESEVDDALVVQELDHLVHVADNDDPADNSILAKMVASDGDWSSFVSSTDAAQSIRDRGDSEWVTATGFSTHAAADVWSVETRQLTSAQTFNLTGNITGNLSGSVGSLTTNNDKTGYGLADDAISASKFDESTAYPLTSSDAGSTAVARTGVDGDTLETLSDEIANVKSDTGNILTDTETTLPNTLSTISSKIDTVDDYVDTEIGAIISAIAVAQADLDNPSQYKATGFSTHSAADVVTALKASTGWTEGGTWTFAELQKYAAAWLMGKWSDNGTTNWYDISDAEDQSTVELIYKHSSTTPQKQVAAQ